MKELVEMINRQLTIETNNYNKLKEENSSISHNDLLDAEKEIKRLTNIKNALSDPHTYKNIEQLKTEMKEAENNVSMFSEQMRAKTARRRTRINSPSENKDYIELQKLYTIQDNSRQKYLDALHDLKSIG